MAARPRRQRFSVYSYKQQPVELMETFDRSIRSLSIGARIAALELSCVSGIGGLVVLDASERGIPVT